LAAFGRTMDLFLPVIHRRAVVPARCSSGSSGTAIPTKRK